MIVIFKIGTFLLLLMISFGTYSQSKMEQIELLNFRVDSLMNLVINSTIVQIDQKDKKITDLENQIVTLKEEIEWSRREGVDIFI